jgi:hypothetical protein
MALALQSVRDGTAHIPRSDDRDPHDFAFTPLISSKDGNERETMIVNSPHD